MQKGAIFSKDKKYRYKLWRVWDNSKPIVGFIGLNPSLADAEIDDPTIIKLITLSTNWGYGGFYISNLFAYISTDPNELINVADPIGVENDKYLHELTDSCDKTVLIWGNSGTLLKRNLEVLKFLNHNDTYCVGLTKYGNPIHPLYQKGDSGLIRFSYQNIQDPNNNQITMEVQENIINRIVLYKINPNEQELNGEVTFDKNVDGRIFSNCLLTIANDTVIIKDQKTTL